MQLIKKTIHFLTLPRAMLIAFSLQIAIVLWVGHYKHPRLWESGAVADNLILNKGYVLTWSVPDDPSCWQSPGYPYLLAFFWRLGGKTDFIYLILSLLNILASVSMLFPLSKLSERWFGITSVKCTLLLALLYPLYTWYVTRLGYISFVFAAHPWIVWLWLRLADQPTRRNIFWAGIVNGLVSFFSPTPLLAGGLLSGALFFNRLKQRQMPAARAIFIAGLLTLLVIGPWLWRCYLVTGDFVLIKNNFGKEFWLGNNPHATGTSYMPGGQEEITYVFPPEAFQQLGILREHQMMKAMQAEGWKYAISDPTDFVKRTTQKIFWLWTSTPAEFQRSYGDGEAKRFKLLHDACWIFFITFGTVAIYRKKIISSEYVSLLLLYVFLYSAIYGLTVVGQARYRAETEFLFLLAAAAGLAALTGCDRQKKSAIVDIKKPSF
jgi:hypothetical protein